MRALTMDEVGFVSGGNVNGPMFTPQSWQQFSATGEIVIVRASGPNTGGGGVQFNDMNDYASAFDQTSLASMNAFWNSQSATTKGLILGGALVAVGGTLLWGAGFAGGALVFGVMSSQTAGTLGVVLATAGGVVAIAGAAADIYASKQ